MRPTLYLICMIAFASMACDPKKPETKPTKDKTPVVKKTPEKTAPKPTTPVKKAEPKKMLSKSQLDAKKAKSITTIYRKHIRDGRKSVHDKRYVDAMDHFKAAIKLDPNNPRALSELGWAAFLGDKLAEARDANTKAIRFTDNIRIKGASYYNLGRVAEKEKDQYNAAVFYQKSLNVRPGNAQVQKRLNALIAAGVKLPKNVNSCAFQQLTAKQTITPKNICSTYAKGKVDKKSPHRCDDPSSYPSLKIDKTTNALIFAYDEEDEFTKTYVLAIQRGTNWYVHPLDSEYNPGAFGISESYKIVTFEAKQLIPGGPPELLLRVHHERFDTDMGINEYETSEYRFTSVVSLEKEIPQLVLELETRRKYERDILHAEEENQEDFQHTKGLPIRKDTGIKASFDMKGNVVIEKSKKLKENNKLGTFKIAEFNQKCLAE